MNSELEGKLIEIPNSKLIALYYYFYPASIVIIYNNNMSFLRKETKKMNLC